MIKKLKTIIMLILSIFICSSFNSNTSFAATSTDKYNPVSVSLNSDYTEKISQSNAEYWYKFTTTSNNAFYRMTYKNLSINGYCKFYIYTEDDEEVYYGSAYHNNEYYKDLELEKNTTYYIKVESYYTGNYRFNISERKDDVGNTMSSSSKINLESTYTNSIDAEYCLDEDWFKFTTTSNDAFYRITYKNLNIDSDCDFYIYSKDMEEIYSGCAYYNDEYYKDLELEKDTTYYIKVVSYRTGNYKFSVKELKDAEPNTLESSKKISLNTGYQGSINANGGLDEDWFKFTTTSDTNYTFKYKNLDIDSYCYFYIYTKDMEEIYCGDDYFNYGYTQELNLQKNKTYYIKVVSYKTGNYNFSILTKSTVAKPTGLKSTSNTSSSIKLAWNKVSNATGYKIYRSTSKNGSYKHVATVKGSSNLTYNDTKLSSGKTYYYKIRAYKSINSEAHNSSYSSILTATTKPASPSVTLTRPSSKAIKVSWKSVSGANGYEVYSSTSKSGTYKKIKTTSSLSYTNSGLKKGKTYYYKVRAYKTFNGKKVYGSYSSVKSISSR